MSVPLITTRIDDLTVAENSANATFDLTQNFDDPLTTGQIARFFKQVANEKFAFIESVSIFLRYLGVSG